MTDVHNVLKYGTQVKIMVCLSPLKIVFTSCEVVIMMSGAFKSFWSVQYGRCTFFTKKELAYFSNSASTE